MILTTGLIIGCSGVDDGVNGEESNTELALNETYDKVRNGARLILTYDAQSNSFRGTWKIPPTKPWSKSELKPICQTERTRTNNSGLPVPR